MIEEINNLVNEIHFTRSEILRHLDLAHARLSKVESLLRASKTTAWISPTKPHPPAERKKEFLQAGGWVPCLKKLIL